MIRPLRSYPMRYETVPIPAEQKPETRRRYKMGRRDNRPRSFNTMNRANVLENVEVEA